MAGRTSIRVTCVTNGTYLRLNEIAKDNAKGNKKARKEKRGRNNSYLLVVPQDVDTWLPAPEVGLVHDVIVYEGRGVDHLCYHGDLPLRRQQSAATRAFTVLQANINHARSLRYKTRALAFWKRRQ